jgi:hypothetical protein
LVRRKSKRPAKKKQATKSRAVKAIEKEIAEETAYLKQLKKNRAAQAARERREKKSQRTAAKRKKTKASRHYKARERESRKAARQRTATANDIREINKLVAVGLYKPKKQHRTKSGRRTYTKGQRASARRVHKKHTAPGGFLSGKYAFVKVPKKERAAFKRAGLPTSRNAVIVYKEEEFDTFKMIKDRQGRPELIGTIEKRRGRRQKKITVTAITLDDMAQQEEKMRAAFEARARELPPGHRIRFFVDGEYGSTRTFSASEFPQFMASIAAYRRSNATLYKFRRNLKIGIIGPGIARNVVKWTPKQYELFQLNNATTGAPSRRKQPKPRRGSKNDRSHNH